MSRGLVSFLFAAVAGTSLFAAEPPKIDGRELFTREWIPNDPRSHGGDGLGPLFNDTSCAACHNQGGIGGGGAEAKNAQIIAVTSSSHPIKPKLKHKPEQVVAEEREMLRQIHAGFDAARGIILHRSATDDGFMTIRRMLIGANSGRFRAPRDEAPANLPVLDERQWAVWSALHSDAQASGERRTSEVNGFRFSLSERNTPALFGSGLLDKIGDDVLMAAATARYDDFPEVTGRVAKLKNGELGRFGWKAQTASLNNFVLTACAVELGLEVPGEPQGTYRGAPLPDKSLFDKAIVELPDLAAQPKTAQKLDLNQEECNALTEFVAALPAPRERIATTDEEKYYRAGGRMLFAQVGCAACHSPKLGEVAGVYSDLLLHDMGSALSDNAAYYGTSPNSTEEEQRSTPLPRLASSPPKDEPVDESKLVGALRREWRTPPLWGVRDSAPYLHDGRAATLEQAIALHGGEAQRSVHHYMKLSSGEQMKLVMFLKSLEAPQ